ncbi:MAG: YbaB/EbfC family nucleoid-associated protein [bacterium]|nr:YbaB/EbfC family nucleoid-associated protein [bacterium]
MNMQSLMAQAQKIQKDIQKKQAEINSTIYSTQNEFLSLEMYGTKKIHKITINKEIVKDSEDLETLEDMLLVAINETVTKIDKDKEQKLGSYASGLNGLL